MLSKKLKRNLIEPRSIPSFNARQCLASVHCEFISRIAGFVDPHHFRVDVAARASSGRNTTTIKRDHHANTLTLRIALCERHSVCRNAVRIARALVVVAVALSVGAAETCPAQLVRAATAPVADGHGL